MSTLPENAEFSAWDWGAVLQGGEAYSGAFAAVPGGNGERCDDITADSIREVIAWHADSPEGWGSIDLVALVQLVDGQFAAVTAWCDTTGWDCQADAQWRVAATKADVIRFGLDDAGRKVLNLVIEA